MSLPELIEWLLTVRYTGPYTVHCLHGRPKMVELPIEKQRIELEA